MRRLTNLKGFAEIKYDNADTDGDGVCNAGDSDDDNDGCLDGNDFDNDGNDASFDWSHDFDNEIGGCPNLLGGFDDCRPSSNIS